MIHGKCNSRTHPVSKEVIEEGRICLECNHCQIYGAEQGYSEYTPSSPMEFECYKGYWDFDQYNINKQLLYKIITMAERCPLFEEDKGFDRGKEDK